MGRSFGRVLAVIWDDEDFKACSPTAQRMYVFLLSQPDLEHSGVIPLRERRWASSCKALTAVQVRADLAELCGARFTVADEETEELLVRSLIRRDEIWRQPNVFKSALSSALAVKSAAIRGTLAGELQRLDLDGSLAIARDRAMAELEAFGKPSGSLSEPFGGTYGGLDAGLAEGWGGDSPSAGKAAGENPSGTLSEPQAKVARAKGEILTDREQPSPSPLPLPPKDPHANGSAKNAEAVPLPGAPPDPETVGQRTNRLTRIYTSQVPLVKYQAAMQIVRRAVDEGLTDEVISSALQDHVTRRKTLTLDSLREAIYGPSSGGGRPRSPRGRGASDDLSGEQYGKGSTKL